jgi:hypothetical protein
LINSTPSIFEFWENLSLGIESGGLDDFLEIIRQRSVDLIKKQGAGKFPVFGKSEKISITLSFDQVNEMTPDLLQKIQQMV